MSTVERVIPVDVSVSAHGPARAPAAASTSPRSPSVGMAVAPWAAAAVVVASAIAVDPQGLRPFTSLRWAAVSLLVAVAAVAVCRAAGSPGLPRSFVVAGTVVIGSMVVAAAAGGDPATSWFGHPQRHLGVLAWLVFGAAACSGGALARTHGGIRLLPVAAVAAAVVTGLTSAIDLAGWSPLGTDFAGGRIGGLFGQPTTLAAFAVLVLPLAATAPVSARLRVLGIAGLVVAVVGAQTRGAFVGLLAVVVVSLPALRTVPRRPRAIWVVAAAAVVLLATPAGARMLSSADSGRVDEWRIAVDVISEHPILGVGPEGYRIAVTDALDDRYVAEHGRDVVIDRAHSAPLDVAAAGGIGSGLAYVVLVGGVAVATWRLQRRAPWSVPAAAGAGAVGCLAAGFVAFPVPEVDAVAWLFAGVAVAAASTGTTAIRSGFRIRPAATVVAAALVTVTAVAGVTDVIADRWLEHARRLSESGRTEEARSAADRATGLRPDLVDGWYVAAQVAAAGPTILDLDAGIDRAATGLAKAPGDPALRLLHAELSSERALRTGLDRDRIAALAVLDALLTDDPTNGRAGELRNQILTDRDRAGP